MCSGNKNWCVVCKLVVLVMVDCWNEMWIWLVNLIVKFYQDLEGNDEKCWWFDVMFVKNDVCLY